MTNLLYILYLLTFLYYLLIGQALCTNTTTFSGYPVVVLHGILSSASKMRVFSEWIHSTFHVQIFTPEIGNGYLTSLLTPLQYQLNELCHTIYKIDELKNGFNFIGMSQGGLLARGYVEQCNKYQVINLITMVSPHGGVYIPSIKLNMYTNLYQKHISIAGYWRDPTNIENYIQKSSYLSLFNNEKWSENSTMYITNIKKLKNIVFIWSAKDEIINPPESGKFSFFDSNLNVVSIFDTELYKNDLLGLRYLNEQNKMHIYETSCTHVQHKDPICFEELYVILKKYL